MLASLVRAWPHKWTCDRHKTRGRLKNSISLQRRLVATPLEVLRLVYTGRFYRATRAAIERRFYGDSKSRVWTAGDFTAICSATDRSLVAPIRACSKFSATLLRFYRSSCRAIKSLCVTEPLYRSPANMASGQRYEWVLQVGYFVFCIEITKGPFCNTNTEGMKFDYSRDTFLRFTWFTFWTLMETGHTRKNSWISQTELRGSTVSSESNNVLAFCHGLKVFTSRLPSETVSLSVTVNVLSTTNSEYIVDVTYCR